MFKVASDRKANLLLAAFSNRVSVCIAACSS